MTDITTVKQRFGIIGTSELLDRALEVALRVAPTDLTVLVTGESGAGKEFFPQVIHAYSARKHNKYIAVNCAAIPEGTIDSELFGHEKGAFTGATEARKGYFEGGRRRHDLPRRGGRAAPRHAGPPAPRAAVGRIHPRRVVAGAQDRRARHRGDERRPAAGRGRRPLPRGSLLPPRHGAHRGAVAARTAGRHSAAVPQIRRRRRDAVPHAGRHARRRSAADAPQLLLARQHPPAEKRRRADLGHRAGAPHHTRDSGQIPAAPAERDADRRCGPDRRRLVDGTRIALQKSCSTCGPTSTS